MDYIKRHMETHILQADQTFKGLLVTGARQVGKSTLLRHVFPERSYLTFDDPILLTQARTEPGLFSGIIRIPSPWMRSSISRSFSRTSKWLAMLRMIRGFFL